MKQTRVGRAGAPVMAIAIAQAGGGIVIDGDADDGAWTSARVARVRLRERLLEPECRPATPAAEARFAWGDGHLYVLLYAADEDVRSQGDFFRVTLAADDEPARRVSFDVGPAGPLPPAIPMARDLDGTIDDASDRDEEWLVEAAVPLSAIGVDGARGVRLTLRVERCDASAEARSDSGAARTCASWGGHAVLD
jgi:hypothetical protein